MKQDARKRKKTPDIDNDQLAAFFRQMYLIRRFEETAEDQYMRGRIRGFLHVYSGEEAIAVGAISALEPQDYVVSHYRDHGHALARGLKPRAVMAELFGKETGCSKGRGGSMHLFDVSRNFMGGYAIVGGQLPIATGLALSSTLQDQNRVVLVFMGDGAISEGEFHESMNLASIWKLPILFFVENNLYGMGTPIVDAISFKEIYKIANAYDMPGTRVDGMNVLEVNAETAKVLDQIRSRRGPAMIEAKTYRFRGHSVADPSSYRLDDEEEYWLARDPIKQLGNLMVSDGRFLESDLQLLRAEVDQEISDACEFAKESPEPTPVDLDY